MIWFMLPEGHTGVSFNGMELDVRDGVFSVDDSLEDRVLKEIPGAVRIGTPDWAGGTGEESAGNEEEPKPEESTSSDPATQQSG